MNIKEVLQAIGLDGKRADLYLASLRLGPSSILSLSKVTGIHRPALYKLLEELEAEGIFFATPSGSRKLFAAVEPERLLTFVKKKERMLEEALPGLTLLMGQGQKKPKIEYYEGREQLKSLYRSVLTEKPNQVSTYFPSRYMADLFGKDAMLQVIQERIDLGIWTNTLRAEDGEIEFEGTEDRKKALREVRYISPDLAPAMGIIIANNTVDLYSPIEESYGIRIKSGSFSKLLQQFFNLLWESGKEG
jgi:sugar-specific transcriptional regulator TrmB